VTIYVFSQLPIFSTPFVQIRAEKSGELRNGN